MYMMHATCNIYIYILLHFTYIYELSQIRLKYFLCRVHESKCLVFVFQQYSHNVRVFTVRGGESWWVGGGGGRTKYT